jgi:hypothetical protein
MARPFIIYVVLEFLSLNDKSRIFKFTVTVSLCLATTNYVVSCNSIAYLAQLTTE